MRRARIFSGIFLITMAVLMLELALTRLFSATMYYHYAFMAISLALFGSGASGVFIYLVQGRLSRRRTEMWLGLSAVAMSVTVLFALRVILNDKTTQDVLAGTDVARLIRLYGATALPFFFGGCAVTIAISRLADDINRLYLCDLAGAAAGCLALIPILNLIGAVNTVLLVAVLAAVAGVILCGGASGGRRALALSIAAALTVSSLLAYNTRTHRIDVRRSKGWEDTHVIFSKWNSFSRITVSGDPGRDDHLVIRIDSDAGTAITRDAGALKPGSEPSNAIEALPYVLKDDSDVLVIGPGGGNDVMTARNSGQRHVTAVEVNPIIAHDVMRSEPFKAFSGDLFGQPGVRLVVDEGRSFIRSNRHRYDLIQATMVDTWAATAAGAFALTENNLYTVEAFRDYAEHLSGDGILAMTRWYVDPPDQLLRLVSLTRAMMRELGIGDAPDHLMVVRGAPSPIGRVPATFLFKKSRFTPDEVHTVEGAAAKNGFELLYTPSTRPDNTFTRLIEAPNPADVWRAYPTNIAPTHDNNPFFFNSIRLSNLRSSLHGPEEWRKSNVGTFVLLVVLGLTSALVVLFILGPLLVARRRDLTTGTGAKLSYLLYFACLGVGFIVVEVAMVQKFILFLGHPVYALAVILFSLLLFSATGSFVSRRFPATRLWPSLVRVLAVLATLVLIYIAVLPAVFYNLVQLALPLRIAIAVVLMAPLALVMGMPMPTGIRILAEDAPEIIPWAWGVNGAASVTGSVAALAVALLSGFNQALMLGASCYLLAIVFISVARFGRLRPVRPMEMSAGPSMEPAGIASR